jgi:polyphenol oxidase
MNSSNSVKIYSELADCGFVAGVTLKNSWRDFDDVYSHVRAELTPPGMKMIVPKQVHGVDIVLIDSKNCENYHISDGVMTFDNDICLTVTTADCLPVLFVDPRSGLRAAVHVGWRCFIGGILENFAALATKLGADIKAMKVVMGPAIESCCFEVGRDVALLFDEQYIRRTDNACYVDLRRAAWNKIESLGVVKSNISGLAECTSCEIDKYYSYRRDKDSPIQMVTFIYKSKN